MEHEQLADEFRAHLRCIHGQPGGHAAVGAALLRQALNVGLRSAKAYRRTMSAPEVALTFIVLEGLQDDLPDLVVRDIGGTNEEVTTGADWEWWIEGDRRWFRMLVQAKRAKASSGRRGGWEYALGQKVGKSGELQVDRLLQASHARGLPAIYALFNPSSASGECTTARCPAMGECLPANADGITTASAQTVKRLVDRAGEDVPLVDVRVEAVPWTCLVACWKDCNIALPRTGRALAGPAVGLARALGYANGVPDAADFAFHAAARVLALTAGSAFEGRAFDAALELVLTGFTEDPPLYILEPAEDVIADAFAGVPNDLRPGQLVVLRKPAQEPDAEPPVRTAGP